MQNLVTFVLASTVIVLAQEKEPRFSIGLGVLAPSYSQKFAGGTLDVDQNKNGFSYSLNNVPHPASGSSASYQSQSNPQPYQSAPGSDYSSQQQGQFSIYQHRSIPKQSSDTSYHSPSNDEQSEGQYTPQQSQGSPHHYQHQSELEHREYNSPSASGAQSSGAYSGPQEYNSEPDYNAEGQNGPNGAQNAQNSPRFAAYNFEQQISHQFMENQQPFESQPQYNSPGGQSYEPQPSHPQSYQSQPSHQRVISLAQPLQSQQQPQYRPQTLYALSGLSGL